MHSRLFFILAACLLMPLLAQAQGAGSVNSLALPSYAAPGYVISADSVDPAGIDRHLIDTRVNYTISAAGTYEIQWSLLNPAGTVMVSSTTSLGSVTTGLPVTTTADGTLEPTAAAPLVPGVLYRLRARLVEVSGAPALVDGLTGSPGKTYLHFPGTDPLSNDRNALTEITSVIIDRAWLLETDATKTTVPVTVGYKVHRYDRWTTTPQNVSLDVTLTPTLTNDADSTVQAATVTNNAFTVSIDGHDNSGSPPAPTGVSSFQTIYVDPSVILKPQMHHIDVQGSHIEIPATSTVKTGGTFASVTTFTPHFTGKLTFGGSITTYFGHIASAPSTIPTVAVPGVISATLRIAPDNNSGTVDGITNYHYGDGTIINVILDEFGDASYTGDRAPAFTSGTVLLHPDTPAAEFGLHNGVQFRRVGDITLDTTGAHSDIIARLPSGVGWSDTRTVGLLTDYVSFGATDYTQTLSPLPATISKSYAAGSFYLCEETKPIYIESTALQWNTVMGEFLAANTCAAHSIRKPLLDFIATYTYADPTIAVKRSNDHVYNRAVVASQPKFKTGTSGGGEMTTILGLVASTFNTHLPYDVEVTYGSASPIKIENDLVATTTPTTSYLATANPVVIPYNQHCQDAYEEDCGNLVSSMITLTSGSGQIVFTADGGLHATGSVSMTSLSWGAIPKPTSSSPQEFAHQVTDLFPTGNFLMAGTFLRGDLNALTDDDGPGVLLLSGFDPANLSTAERPSTVPYINGLGDYAGVNFRCTAGAFDGLSTLQGDPYTPYTLTARSKYYARTSGVTGIHEAENGTFPATASIGGYDFTLDTFGFSFLSTDQEDSRTSGMLDLSLPTDFTLDFSELTISCIGALESFSIDGAGSITKEFNFWDCLFTPYTATFESVNDCQPGDGTTLVLGFGAYASHFEDEIVGQLGIHTDGSFVTPNLQDTLGLSADVPTRIRLPAALKVTNTDGASNETYEFFPSQGAYLSDDSTGEGFWSLFGGLDVPFFRDMQVHLHVRCGSITGPEPATELTSLIHMMGGWPSNGWLESSLDPFTSTEFDQHNAGFTGTTLALYRSSGTEQYHPRAQQEWLGDIIDFDYPVEWSNTAFNFSGLGPIAKDLIVVQTQHELVYMDSENAEITFGVRYDGLPEISLTNFVFNAVDDLTGTSSAMIEAAGEHVFGALENGVDEFANALSDKAENLLGTALNAVTAPVINNMVTALKAKINTGVYTNIELNAIIEDYTTSTTSPVISLTEALNTLDDATTFLADLDARLAKIQQGIDSVINTVTIDPDTGLALPVEQVANGLLKQVDVDGEMRRVVFELLSGALVDVLSDLVDASTIEEDLAALIQEQEPTLAAVTTILTDIRSLITDLRTEISSLTNLGEEIKDIINSPTGIADILAISLEVKASVGTLVLSAPIQDFAQLDSLAIEWQEVITTKIEDAFYATAMVAEIQEAVKERLYDLQASFNEAVDTAFAALNDAIREALSDVLAELDTSINDTLGSFGDKLGAGSLTGYAHINGDSLDELRIDGDFELRVPDDLSLNAYLQIKEIDSDGPAGCSSAAGAVAAEVTIGTTDMSLGWTGLGADGVRADMSVKFGLTSGVPSSMGGAFEMTSGEIGFETFEIYRLAASVMFGTGENYIAAAIGVRFGEFDVAGGVFFGRSCDLEPLKLIDPLVADVIPTSTITGIYAYGEGTFPIVGGTCFFNISAKAGAGVFYFQEGPTYGGRMTLGVFGEGLCAVEIGAEVSLAGSKSGDSYNFAGYGRIFGQAGKCPLCVKASFQVDFKYTDSGGWDVQF